MPRLDYMEHLNEQWIQASVANTKTSWSEITSSTGYDANGLMFNFFVNLDVTSTLYDIAIGASGSEVVLAADIPVYSSVKKGSVEMDTFFLPCSIPAGSRLAYRIQCSSTSADNHLLSALVRGSFPQYNGVRKVVGCGGSASTSQPPRITFGSGSKGSYVEVGSWDVDIQNFIVRISNEDNIDPTGTEKIDIAFGGSGSEVVVFADLPFYMHVTSDFGNPRNVYLDLPVLANTTLSVRGQSTASSNLYRRIAFIGYAY